MFVGTFMNVTTTSTFLQGLWNCSLEIWIYILTLLRLNSCVASAAYITKRTVLVESSRLWLFCRKFLDFDCFVWNSQALMILLQSFGCFVCKFSVFDSFVWKFSGFDWFVTLIRVQCTYKLSFHFCGILLTVKTCSRKICPSCTPSATNPT